MHIIFLHLAPHRNKDLSNNLITTSIIKSACNKNTESEISSRQNTKPELPKQNDYKVTEQQETAEQREHQLSKAKFYKAFVKTHRPNEKKDFKAKRSKFV